MRSQWWWLTLVPFALVQASPPVAITVDAIENGLDPGLQQIPARGARGPAGIVTDEPASLATASTAMTEPPTVIAPIEFDSGKATIRYESLPILHSYAVALQGERLKKLVFAVAGHTDSDGSEDFNLLLSQRRAQAVQEYLVQQYGIQPWRLRVEAYGENKPLDSNSTPHGKARNRRVEFVRLVGVE